MKLFLFCFLIVLPVSASSIINEVRELFPIIKTVDEADILISKLQNETTPISKAYIAAMYFMKSKHVKFPLTKFKHFKKGKKMLDILIQEHPKNIEMRYIRFLFQHQIPKFLGYNENINEDFEVIMQYALHSKLEHSFKTRMLKNMLLVKNQCQKH